MEHSLEGVRSRDGERSKDTCSCPGEEAVYRDRGGKRVVHFGDEMTALVDSNKGDGRNPELAFRFWPQ